MERERHRHWLTPSLCSIELKRNFLSDYCCILCNSVTLRPNRPLNHPWSLLSRTRPAIITPSPLPPPHLGEQTLCQHCRREGWVVHRCDEILQRSCWNIHTVLGSKVCAHDGLELVQMEWRHVWPTRWWYIYYDAGVCLSQKINTSSWKSPVTIWTTHNHPVQLQVIFDGSRLVFHGSMLVFIGF